MTGIRCTVMHRDGVNGDRNKDPQRQHFAAGDIILGCCHLLHTPNASTVQGGFLPD
jgi:hypothetical protein